jgi:hypothetical protein
MIVVANAELFPSDDMHNWLQHDLNGTLLVALRFAQESWDNSIFDRSVAKR